MCGCQEAIELLFGVFLQKIARKKGFINLIVDLPLGAFENLKKRLKVVPMLPEMVERLDAAVGVIDVIEAMAEARFNFIFAESIVKEDGLDAVGQKGLHLFQKGFALLRREFGIGFEALLQHFMERQSVFAADQYFNQAESLAAESVGVAG